MSTHDVVGAAGGQGVVAAVDLGATSGRVMLGYVGPTGIRLEPVARFANVPVRTIDGLHWNILELYRNVIDGLTEAVRREPGISSIAVDSWAVDYALLRGDRMLGNPFHYRDDRTAVGVEATHALVGQAELYRGSGLQFLPFNTVYQLAAERIDAEVAPEAAPDASARARAQAGLDALDLTDTLLLIPDLIAFWLTGERRAESTNASTTGLFDVHTREWNDELIAKLRLPRHLFPPLIEPGETIGMLLPSVTAEIGAPAGLRVTAVGSHDTASAVLAVPATGEDFAYISSGTWSLVGVELEHPVVSDESRAANFTNEGGVDGRVRFLQNVSGLWLLSESVRTWERLGTSIPLADLLEQAAAITTPVAVFDAGDPVLIAPGDMPARIAAWCVEHGLPAPETPAEFARSILESLADAYAVSLRQAGVLSGKVVRTIHIVGGGSQNALLCQLTADRTGLPVLAGPVEATAIGNVLLQARARGLISGDLAALRALVAASFPPVRYTPAR
ncbi:rhamnulokinase [Subtercola boreus]|uniref:Rhamnulokinase n=1 Tax=Subtercola boreus TaxID=120213 RepID=A0A3E0WGW9_9MICO|nr:rhamnulokinase family protein [Subtercola boreus]RFA23503.1 rhamnulokinase [Subtercola boreus]RFA23896.1 rhamnulokinase [Subtercola boreus]RFA29596.1 rhamnulokinase [Subtercola boreus]